MSAYSQVIEDPISVMKKENPKATFGVWILDLNQDGVPDMLVTVTPDETEVAEEKESFGHLYEPSQTGFTVFIGQKGGYAMIKDVDFRDPYKYDADGVVPGSITIILNDCFAGYVKEIKQYGIITIEKFDVDPPSGHGRAIEKDRVICYYMKNNHLIQTYLTGYIDNNSKNPIVEKYLIEKRTIVTLKA